MSCAVPRLGLCCQFVEEPIAFRTATAAALGRMSRRGALQKLGEIAVHNAGALAESLRYCAGNGIGCFRIGSSVLPLRTHPKAGYVPHLLPNGREVVRAFRACGAFATDHGLRVTFHPDQFVVLNSPDPRVVESSVEELEHLAEVAEWAGADVLTVHGGGAYGDKAGALARLEVTIAGLSAAVRSRIAIENDERVFSPAELLPLCRKAGVPFVYDVHHHRCYGDGVTVEEATSEAVKTWGGREPLFHISSPLEGWSGPRPARHHDFIDSADWPGAWCGLAVTVEVEAKAKEVAVRRLREDLMRSAECGVRSEQQR